MALRIYFTMHHFPDGNSGAPRSTQALIEEAKRAGAVTELFSYENVNRKFPMGIVRRIFPILVCLRYAYKVAFKSLVIDSHTGDAGLLVFVPRFRTSVIVVRSHGLEHIAGLKSERHGKISPGIAGATVTRLLKLVDRWFVAASIRHADGVSFLNSTEMRFARRYFALREQTVRIVPNGSRATSFKIRVKFSTRLSGELTLVRSLSLLSVVS